MSHLTKSLCILLCALPLAALADPVTITTRSAGTIKLDATVLQALGLDNTAQEGQLPYEVILRSTIDPAPAAPGYGQGVYELGSDTTVDFRVGTMSYHYAGAGLTDANLYNPFGHVDVYQHRITIVPPAAFPYAIQLTNYGEGPLGSFGTGGALWPHDVDESAGLGGSFRVQIYESNSSSPNFWDMNGIATAFSVQVVGAVTAPPVPEPASYGMLAAGMLTLGWWRRRTRGGRRPVSSTA